MSPRPRVAGAPSAACRATALAALALAACNPAPPAVPAEASSAPIATTPAVTATAPAAGGAPPASASAAAAPSPPNGDTDGDGIPDERDACPREPGRAAADGHANGCPIHIRWHEDHVELRMPIAFDIEKATIRPSSFDVLAELRDAIAAHGEVGLFEIQGHYPSREHAARSISQVRADSVRKYLVHHGIDAARLQSRGYGDSKPLADPKTAEGRARNRRIEIWFIKR